MKINEWQDENEGFRNQYSSSLGKSRAIVAAKIAIHSISRVTIACEGATLKAVSKATGFQKTHQFLLQEWEALYRHCLLQFREHMADNHTFQEVFEDLKGLISSKQQNAYSFVWTPERICNASKFYKEFSSFLSVSGEANPMLNFWQNFICRDMLRYFGLFCSIRNRDFTLRNTFVRLLAPISLALDRPMYLRLVPEHLASLKLFPHELASTCDVCPDKLVVAEGFDRGDMDKAFQVANRVTKV
ncbi:hypothetical protein HOLleu_01106 [Holothuria leucospilota]|uniref:Uncharacterized protein n=1 Tax=Holothuria leucospilota TaxID=206669 RepID=A0A9Q1CN16_HOLLE|nr:hypothetical protein HOLleu_01106 [Holothuria leucospilota]